MAKGRHAGGESGSFYRDLAMMAVGIILVGAAVFLLLYLLVGDGSTPATSTTSSLAVSTEVPGETTTTSAESTTTTVATTTTSESVPVKPPSEVRVIVLNSVGIPGAAGRFTTVLTDAGYQTLQPADFEPEQDPTRIWFRDGFSAEASALLDFIPGAIAEPLPDSELEPGADIVVVLGLGYEE